MRLSNLADYAVVLLAAAARSDGVRLSATCLAAQTGVPLPTAQKLVGRLAAADLIISSRGTGGGFRLARDPSAISLADIVEAVEGKIAMTTCVDHGRHDCAVELTCRVKPHWNAVNDAMRGALAGVSLASLAQTPPPAPSPSTACKAGAQDKLHAQGHEIEGHSRAKPANSRSARKGVSTSLDANGSEVLA